MINDSACDWRVCVCTVCSSIGYLWAKEGPKATGNFSPLKSVDFTFYLSDYTAKHKF